MSEGEMKKFMFDTNDFDAVTAKEEPAAPPPPTFSQEELETAQTEAYARGKAAGEAEARAAREELIRAAVQQLARASETLVRGEDRRELEQMIGATRLALRVARKLLPDFARRSALPEAERTILDALHARQEEPRITVFVPPALHEPLRERIEEMAAAHGIAGRIALTEDDTLDETDCRIEWAEGGAERVFEDLFARIESEFEKAAAAMKMTADMQDDQENDDPTPGPGTAPAQD